MNQGSRLLQECEDQGLELLEVIRQQTQEKSVLLQEIRNDVFFGFVRKVDLFFAFGSAAHEFDFLISKLSEQGSVIDTSDICTESINPEDLVGYPFDLDDLKLYMACRNCFTDFQSIIVQLERHLWVCTFSVLFGEYGPDWITRIDLNKRQSWASVREAFRSSSCESPLHEFSSIPDIRDIITSSKHWTTFSKKLPSDLSDRKILKSRINDILIPCRNKIFHPTRELSLTFSEYQDLKQLLKEINKNEWRDLDFSNTLGSSPELPIPQRY